MGTAVQGCPEPPDPCKDLLQEILEFVAVIQKHWNDLKLDKGGLPLTKPTVPDPRYGYRSITGERQQYKDRQKGLKNRLDRWEDNGCGPKPELATKWEKEPIPVPDAKPAGDTMKRAAEVGAGVSAGYLLYRGIRMIPSLFPPLWWTLPENALAP